MSVERFTNNGQTVVAVAYTAGSTTLTVSDASKLPTLTGGDQFHIVVFTPANPSNAEIMVVTAVSGNVLTVTPAAEAIGGIQMSFNHPTNDTVANELSKDSLTAFIQQIAPPTYFAVNKSGSTFVVGSPVTTHSSGTGVVLAGSADNNANAVGLATLGVADGAAETVQTSSHFSLADWTAVTGTATLTARAVYFLSDTPGMLTDTAPISGVLQVVGRAVAPDTLEINLQPSILL